MAKNKAATAEDVKRIAVEAPVNEVEKDVENPSPLTGAGEVVASAQSAQKDTPTVDIKNVDGTIVSEEVGLVKNTGAESVPGASKAVTEAEDDSDELTELKAKVTTLEKDANDLRAKMRAADKRVGDLLKERDALKKEILESPTEKLRAELEVARREYELLLGNQQKPNKQFFG